MKKGFSFIELMVIVAILAIILTMATLPYMNAKHKAVEEVCKGNTKMLEIAVSSYNSQVSDDKIPDDVQYLSVHKEKLVEFMKAKAWPVCKGNGYYFMKDGMVFCSEHGRFSGETGDEGND